MTYPDSSESLNRETDDAVYFFTTSFHPFDNFSAHAVKVWDMDFPTVEHAFHWKKFEKTNPDAAEEIRTSSSPDAAQKLSRTHKNYVPINWHEDRVAVMKEILRAKAEQHEDVREALRRSGEREIIENSPWDSFWGIGPDGKGENVVGKLWMKIREEFGKAPKR